MVRSGEIDDLTAGEELQCLAGGQYIGNERTASKLLDVVTTLRGNQTISDMLADNTLSITVRDEKLIVTNMMPIQRRAIMKIIEEEGDLIEYAEGAFPKKAK